MLERGYSHSGTAATNLGPGHQDAVAVVQLAAAAQRRVTRHVEQAVAEDDRRPRVSVDSQPLGGALLWLPLILEQVAKLLPVEDFHWRDTRLASFLYAGGVVSQHTGAQGG